MAEQSSRYTYRLDDRWVTGVRLTEKLAFGTTAEILHALNPAVRVKAVEQPNEWETF